MVVLGESVVYSQKYFLLGTRPLKALDSPLVYLVPRNFEKRSEAPIVSKSQQRPTYVIVPAFSS